MNKAVIAGIIAVIAIGIGIAITSNFDLETTTDESENITLESQEPETNEFKIELKEEIGLEAQPWARILKFLFLSKNDHFGSILVGKIPLCLINIGRLCSLMKRQTSVAMFGILFAAAMTLGIVSISEFSQPLFVASTDMKAENHMGMLGHITFTTTDQDGNILSYIQTDNVIVNVGENCVAESLFNVTTSSADQPCAGTGTHTGLDSNGVADGGFTYIEIGTGSTGLNTANETNTALLASDTRIKANTTTVAPSSGTGSTAIVTLTGIFTAGVSAPTINESGVFDSLDGTGNNNMLARQTFTDIPLTEGDKLTVEWEIKIGS